MGCPSLVHHNHFSSQINLSLSLCVSHAASLSQPFQSAALERTILRNKLVFVFDGGTPGLKHRAVIARCRHCENAQAKIRKIVKKLLLNHVMIITGTDTSAMTVEWAMSLLVNHPKVLMKAKAELDAHLGQDHFIDKPDLTKLYYLQAIISNTFLLFPATPLLVAHMSSNDCTIGGFDVPHDTILLVNSCAFHKDPKVWDNPTWLKPERFERGEVEGHKLMPFGMGRRACPRSDLAQHVVSLTLGSLIQCFEWERVEEELGDLTEGKGLSMPKAVPLEAMCKA